MDCRALTLAPNTELAAVTAAATLSGATSPKDKASASLGTSMPADLACTPQQKNDFHWNLCSDSRLAMCMDTHWTRCFVLQ